MLYIITDFHDREGKLTGGLLVSRDGAQTWEPAYEPLLAMRPASRSDVLPGFAALATSFTNPKVVYVSYKRLVLGDRSTYGVARSDDAGLHWNLVWQESGSTGGPNIFDAWTTDAFGADWGENPISLGVQDTNPNIVYGTDYGRTMRSTDGGKTWMAVYSYQVAGGGYTTTGLDVTTAYGIHFDPFDPQRRFISYTDIGLFRSEDGGKSWIYSGKGIPRAWRNTTYWIVLDPQVRGRMWAASSGTHDLPRLKMFRKPSPTTFKGGVSLSEDGGKTWKPSNQGMPEAAVTYLLLDPSSLPPNTGCCSSHRIRAGRL